jgi:hypothetical protein
VPSAESLEAELPASAVSAGESDTEVSALAVQGTVTPARVQASAIAATNFLPPVTSPRRAFISSTKRALEPPLCRHASAAMRATSWAEALMPPSRTTPRRESSMWEAAPSEA